MTIKSLALNADVRLENFCKAIEIKYTSDLTEESTELHLYDVWLDDSKISLLVKPDRINFFNHDYSITIYRDEFLEVVII